jgi:hypothetical protein
MRRPYRLHRGPFEEDIITQQDFSPDAMSCSALEFQSRRIATLAFIWLCKLSEIMAAIAVFQQRTKFSREWNGENIQDSISELEEAIVFDREIRNWKNEFEADVLDVDQVQSDHAQDVSLPVCILRIVCK